MTGHSVRKGIDIEHFVKPFYEIGSSTEILPGQLVWAPSLYPNQYGNALDIIEDKYDPSESIVEFVIKPYKVRSTNFPVKRLDLAADEYYFAIKGKIRLGIVIAGGIIEWGKSAKEKLYICTPLYTVSKPRITQEFVVKVQANQYPMYFYIQPDGKYNIKESIARFPLMQIIHGNTIEYYYSGHHPISLSDEALGWLKTQLGLYLGCQVDKLVSEALEVYGELVNEEYERLRMK